MLDAAEREHAVAQERLRLAGDAAAQRQAELEAAEESLRTLAPGVRDLGAEIAARREAIQAALPPCTRPALSVNPPTLGSAGLGKR